MAGSGLDGFARDAQVLARSLRALPAELRKELGAQVRDEVAEPLAQKVAAAARGPWAGVIRGGVKVRAQADPTIAIGGTARVLSGGGSVRDVIWGTEYGGGNRVSVVNRERDERGRKRHGRIGRAEFARRAAAGRVIYKRHTTKQFVPAHPFVYDEIERNIDWVLARFAEIVTTKALNYVDQG